MKKLAHISIFWGYQAGVINKLESLAKTCIEKNILIDFILITIEKKELKELKYLKVYFIGNKGNIFKKRKLQVDILNKLQKNYYKIIMRYPLFDPIILLFLKRKKKYVFEHHTKEIEELKLKRDKRYFFEKYFGSKWLLLFGGIIGVTKEIESYEVKRSNFKGFHTFMPNSIILDEKRLDGKIFKNKTLNIVMVANFRPWHGLEKIISEMEKDKEFTGKYNFHIVGEVKDINLIRKINSIDSIRYYGFMCKNKIEKLYEKMDIGLGVFNVNVLNLKETTSLKIREYFSKGLLVYTSNIDPAFPKDFLYLLQNESFSLSKLFEFVCKYKELNKEIIKQSAKPYIDSKIILNNLYYKVIKG